MDHVINSITPYYEVYLDIFLQDWKKSNGKYKKFSDSPFYEDIKAIIDAINILYKAEGLGRHCSLKEEVDFYINMLK